MEGLGSLEFEADPVYSYIWRDFSIKIFKGRLANDMPIICKTYTALINIQDLYPIKKEIEILTLLSNQAENDNCFIKFYGYSEDKNSISLFMEGFSYNLRDFIIWRYITFKTGTVFFEKWIILLIQSFAELTTLGIYHRDIKPHNIVVNVDDLEDAKIKIIDFSISQLSDHLEITSSPTGSFPIQGTKGYMAPELEAMLAQGLIRGNFNIEKADVFSLGLTILQMITCRDLTALNIESNNPTLIKIVEEADANDWVKMLIKGMLKPKSEDRLSFNECLAFLPRSFTPIL